MSSHALKGGTPREQLTKREVANEFAAALNEDFGHYAAKHKVVARLAGANSPKTAEAWACMHSLPGLEYFLELGKHSPAIRKLVARLWHLDPDLDPEYGRTLSDIHTAIRELKQMVGRIPE